MGGIELVIEKTKGEEDEIQLGETERFAEMESI
jgi:hypothetical protein